MQITHPPVPNIFLKHKTYYTIKLNFKNFELKKLIKKTTTSPKLGELVDYQCEAQD